MLKSLYIAATLTAFIFSCEACHNLADGGEGMRSFFENPETVKSEVENLLEGHSLPPTLESCVTNNIKKIIRSSNANPNQPGRPASLSRQERGPENLQESCNEYRQVCNFILVCAIGQGYDIPQLHFLLERPFFSTTTAITTTALAPSRPIGHWELSYRYGIPCIECSGLLCQSVPREQLCRFD